MSSHLHIDSCMPCSLLPEYRIMVDKFDLDPGMIQLCVGTLSLYAPLLD